MNPLKQMLKRAQEDWQDIGDTLLGDHAQRLLDDEIRNADDALRDLRNTVLNAKANLFTSDEHRQALQRSIAGHEEQAAKALQRRNLPLARDIALQIAGLERELSDTQQQIARTQSHIAQLQHLVLQGEGKLRRLKHQLDTIRISESLQRAQGAVRERHDGSGAAPRGALDLLKRARRVFDQEAGSPQRGHHEDGAGDEEGTGGAHLRDATGIDEREQADAVLARLARRAGPAATAPAPPQPRAPKPQAPRTRTRTPPRKPKA